MSGLPLGVAPQYSIVSGLSALGHEGPGPGNSIFGARHTEFDRPWLATLSGRRNMQPNVAHQMNRIGEDGVVRDPLGSGAEYRHDGFVAAATPGKIGTEDASEPPYVWTPDLGYSDYQKALASDPGTLYTMANDLQKLKATIDALDPPLANQAEIDQYLLGVIQEYDAAYRSGFSQGHATPESTKFAADAVSVLATYTNIYNETDLFPNGAVDAANAMGNLMGHAVVGDPQGTLQYFMNQVEAAYNTGKGQWSAANVIKFAQQSGYEIDSTSTPGYLEMYAYNYSALGSECESLLANPDTQAKMSAIASQFTSGNIFNTTWPTTNPPWGGASSGGQAPSIWGTYYANGNPTEQVVNGTNQLDEAVLYAAQAVHALWLSQPGHLPAPPPQPSGGGGISGGSTPPPKPPGPNDGALIAAGIAVALGALVYKAYA